MDQASLEVDHAYLSLINPDAEDLLLDLTCGEDPPSDLIFEEQKSLCGKNLEGPTLESAQWEDHISEMN